MPHCARYFFATFSILLFVLGFVLTPAPSWAIKGFRGDVIALVDTEVTFLSIFSESFTIRLDFFVTLELENGDPTPPQGIAVLEVTDPNGIVYNIINSNAFNATTEFLPPDSFHLSVPFFNDTDGDFLPDIPVGDYKFHLKTTGGAEFFATKKLQNVTRLETPVRLAPVANARVTTTPTFKWRKVPGAVAYRVRIRRSRQGFIDPLKSTTEPLLSTEDANLFTSADLTGVAFKLPAGVLSPGRTYYWDVEALNGPSLGEADNRTRRNGRDVLAPFSVLGPYAEMRLAFAEIKKGQRQKTTVRIANTAGTAVKVIVQAWLSLPTGVVQALTQSGVTGPRTLGAGLVSDLVVYNKLFGATDPVGTYAIGVRLLDPITGDHLGNEVVQQFVFTGQ